MSAPPGFEAREVPVAADEHTESDASVVRRSLEDPDAFSVLFDRYADDIHRYAARRLGTEAADDLMAETFVIVMNWGTWVNAVSFGMIFLILLARPQGLLGRKEVRRT